MVDTTEMLSENFTKKLRQVLLEADPDQGPSNTNEDRLGVIEQNIGAAGVRIVNGTVAIDPEAKRYLYNTAHNGYTVKFNPKPTATSHLSGKIDISSLAEGESITILIPLLIPSLLQLQNIIKPASCAWCAAPTMAIGGKVTFYRYGGVIYV